MLLHLQQRWYKAATKPEQREELEEPDQQEELDRPLSALWALSRRKQNENNFKVKKVLPFSTRKPGTLITCLGCCSKI